MADEIFAGAFALIRRVVDEREQWLVRHHECSQTRKLISAERLEDESFREAIDREIAWGLNLERGKDYLLSSVPRLHMELMLKSPQEDATTVNPSAPSSPRQLYFVEFYVADIYREKVLHQLSTDRSLVWLENHELRGGVCDDSTPIDPFQMKLIQKGELIPHASR